MTLRAGDEEMLKLVVDEAWDLTEAIGELERRREKLRDVVLEICRDASVSRWTHARGNIRLDRYKSYKVARPTLVLPQLDALGWHDDVLSVKGRALHKLAQPLPGVRSLLDGMFPEVQHEVLVMTPTKRRRRE